MEPIMIPNHNDDEGVKSSFVDAIQFINDGLYRSTSCILQATSSQQLLLLSLDSTLELDVINWNNSGIFLMELGKDIEAENCFLYSIHNYKRIRNTVYQQQHQRQDKCKRSFERNDMPQRSTLSLEDILDKVSSIYSKMNIACYSNLGGHGYDEGMNVYTKALQVFCDGSLIGNAIHDALMCSLLLYNAGLTNTKRGLYNDAYELFELSLECLQSGNIEHVAAKAVLVQIQHNLGYCLHCLGMNEDSLQWYQNALDEIRQNNLPELYSASAQNSIAVLLFHIESIQSASHAVVSSEKCIHLLRNSLKIYTHTNGRASVTAATVLNNIGRVLTATGEYEPALSIYQEALSIRREMLGENSFDTAATICNIGEVYHKLGNTILALNYYNHFISLAKHHFSASTGTTSDVAIVLRCIAELYHSQKKVDEAMEYYKHAMETSLDAVGKYHPEISLILNKLGNLHYEKKEYEMSLQYYKEGLSVEQVIFDPYHPHIATTLNNIAHIYREQKDYQTALSTYWQLQTIRCKVYGPDHVQVANVMLDIGMMQCQLHQYQNSYETYQNVLKIQCCHYGADGMDNLEVSSTYASLGLTSYKIGNKEDAITCFSESLRIRTVLLGPDHKNLVTLWYNLATIQLERGEEETAIDMYREALRIEKLTSTNNNNSKNYDDILLTLQNLGYIHHQRDEYDDAIECYMESIQLLESENYNTDCSNKEETIAILWNFIGTIYIQAGNVQKTMDCVITAARILSFHSNNSSNSSTSAGTNCVSASASASATTNSTSTLHPDVLLYESNPISASVKTYYTLHGICTVHHPPSASAA